MRFNCPGSQKKCGSRFWGTAFFLGSCEMLMCISTAQDRTKSAPRFWGSAFFLFKNPYKVALVKCCEMLTCILIAQAPTKFGPRFWGAAFFPVKTSV